jgi:5-methylcytosine-specific restriction protein A
MCKPRLTIATVCDHIRPHKGDAELFWSSTNLQGLCAPHHDSTKQAEEKGRKRVQIGPDGWPVEDAP